MTIYEKIRERLNELIPSRLKLKVGCEFEVIDEGVWHFSGHWTNPKSPIRYENEGYMLVKHGMGWSGHECETKEVYTVSDGNDVQNENIKVLGTPPTLQEVLLALAKTPHIYDVEVEVCTAGYTNKPIRCEIVARWDTSENGVPTRILYDLTKDLKDQSEETLQSILRLLE